jgi:pyruvate formate lyase activating enzyme
MHCTYCEWRCDLSDGRLGVCRMYAESRGEIKERFPDSYCTYSISRIESLPFYHVYPGSRSMTLGTSSCNFKCRYCSNGFIARQRPEEVQERMFNLTPRDLVGLAKKGGCHNIVFNVNEPAVSLPSLQALSREARKEGFAMGCLTNGYTTEEATQIMASVFSFFNIGLKGFSDRFHRDFIGVPGVAPILRNIRTLARTCHIEVTTPVIQPGNEEELDAIADFLADVDPQIPWHVFRLLPEHDMKDCPYPDITAIDQSLRAARKKLSYVYFHNFVGSEWVNTLCPGCGRAVIERFSLGCGGDRLDQYHCTDNRCPACGYEIAILGERTPWRAGEVTP